MTEKFIVHEHVYEDELPTDPETMREVLTLVSLDYDIVSPCRDYAGYYIVEHTYE